MPLTEIQFSDLLLFPDGSARLKGCPGAGPQLVPVPEACASEVADLPDLLGKHGQAAMRYRHRDITYRVARIDDVDGQRIWFLRRLAETVPSFESLGLLPVLCSWLMGAEQRQGLILFSGAQASGKTTTASAFVARRLEVYGGHSVTFENPAELPLAGSWGQYGYCFQTEITSETELAQEIERAHRYASPDIIFIGEIRTRHAALEALRVSLGSSRQLVVATIHGQDVITALERLVTWARELDGDNAGQNLADALLAAVHLSLEIGPDGSCCLTSPQFLLLPFKDSSRGIRVKLRNGQFSTLTDDMRELKARIANKGEQAI
ncbi:MULTISPECIES: ATPase, T2SS/T4P/T4SS family [Desulfovibrio]|uniref:Twitching motility protein PilT n=2 Tax=Desulfovibrio TaxID=872 RepID=A0AA94HTF0_DESDE|nr:MULTISPECIES: ATPase, T2SS/T4P/T4SS family [Desulfovibrio]ATD82341.1 type II secretion system protein E [Desulfovibrio sp. G11]SFW55326.1 twitching motility protein PilT [Desulfovibrio desulfuricans]SPD35114.1 Type II secretion system protein E [Desulfovibrio sp. G11]